MHILSGIKNSIEHSPIIPHSSQLKRIEAKEHVAFALPSPDHVQRRARIQLFFLHDFKPGTLPAERLPISQFESP